MTKPKPRKCDCGAVMWLGVSGFVCPECPGKVKAANQQDRDYYPDELRLVGTALKCTECDGTGILDCDECDGDCWVSCPHCGQQMDCDECDGTGKVECWKC